MSAAPSTALLITVLAIAALAPGVAHADGRRTIAAMVPIGGAPRAQDRHTARVDACEDYARLAVLARLDDRFAGERLAWIDAARADACRGPIAAGEERWPNGVCARNGRGDWYYPNGLQARDASGNWYYPNGLRARDADGALYYPNGVRARSSEGRWYLPNGVPSSPEDLLRRACESVSATDDRLCASAEPNRLDTRLVLLAYRRARSTDGSRAFARAVSRRRPSR